VRPLRLNGRAARNLRPGAASEPPSERCAFTELLGDREGRGREPALPHLHGDERVLEVPLAGVALVLQPLLLGPPGDVLLRLPDVLASSGEAEGLDVHLASIDALDDRAR